jgi:hypothetical protein
MKWEMHIGFWRQNFYNLRNHMDGSGVGGKIVSAKTDRAGVCCEEWNQFTWLRIEFSGGFS